eukprot:gene63893-87386_t
MFDLARIDSGQVRLHVERVDVPELLHDLELQYRPVAESRGLDFRVHVVRSRLGSGSVFRVALHDADEAVAQARVTASGG